MNHSLPFLASLSLLACLPALNAGDPASGKSRHHLFNPTPVELMREMSTDRPDTTESPITVDAGHIQVEASFFDYIRDRDGGIRSETWGLGLINFKLGLTHSSDLQIVFDSYTQERVSADGITEKISGFSDITTRLKINLWGNDGGPTALAVMPYVKAPTGTRLSNDKWEGGIIMPFGFDIAEGIDVGLMAEADLVYDDATGSYEVEWLHSATVGFPLTERLGMYLEYFGIASAAAGFQYQAYGDAGFTFAFSGNVQLDCGVRIGLTRAAEDIGIFTGISFRY